MLTELGHGVVAKAILEAIGEALVSYWYLWLLLIVAAVRLSLFNDWSKRFEKRRQRQRARRGR